MIDALLKINNFDILYNLLRSIDRMIDRIVEEYSKLWTVRIPYKLGL